VNDTTDRIEDARRLDARQEAARLGLVVTPDGKGFYNPEGRGPRAKSPSGSFYRKGGTWRWHLFSDGSGGDCIDLVCWVRGCTLMEALDELLNDARPKLKPVKYPEPEEAPVVPYGVRVRACEAFLAALDEPPAEALVWLAEKYGILAPAVGDHRLAVAHEDNANRAMQAAITATDAATVQALGLATPSKADLLNCPWGWGAWLVIPYFDRQGRCGHLQARRWNRSDKNTGKGTKYRHVRGEVPYPWGVHLSPGDRPMLVEGALDAIRLRQEGVEAVGVPGTSWVRPERADRLRAYSPSWLVAFDGDAPGRKAQAVVSDLLAGEGATVATVEWPEDFAGDWCDVYQSAEPPSFAVWDRVEPEPETEGWTFAELLTAGADEKVEIAAGTRKRPGFPTGIHAVDQLSNLLPGSYHIVAARSGDGKTHYCLSAGVSMAATYGTRNHFVSLEMTKMQLQERIACGELRLAQHTDLPPSNLADRATEAISRRMDLPFTFSECEALWPSLEAHLDRLMERDEPPEVIWIDYGQEIEVPNASGMEDRGAKASKGLKAWGKRNQSVALVVAVQLNRPGGKDTGNRPSRWQVRGSNQWTQDADYIALLFDPNEADPGGQDSEIRKVIVDKVRNGSVGMADIRLPSPFGWFCDITALQGHEQKARGKRDVVFS